MMNITIKKHLEIYVTEKGKLMIKKSSYQNYLIESLKDPKEAIGYLNAALEGGDLKVFLLALRNVIQAKGGISKIAQKTHKSRTSLYKALSDKGNPYLESTNDVLGTLGMHLQIAPLEKIQKNKRKRKAA